MVGFRLHDFGLGLSLGLAFGLLLGLGLVLAFGFGYWPFWFSAFYFGVAATPKLEPETKIQKPKAKHLQNIQGKRASPCDRNPATGNIKYKTL